MARRKRLPTYPMGTRVHVRWVSQDINALGTVLEEPSGDNYMWLVDVPGHPETPLALVESDIVGTAPADESLESIREWLHPA